MLLLSVILHLSFCNLFLIRTRVLCIVTGTVGPVSEAVKDNNSFQGMCRDHPLKFLMGLLTSSRYTHIEQCPIKLFLRMWTK